MDEVAVLGKNNSTFRVLKQFNNNEKEFEKYLKKEYYKNKISITKIATNLGFQNNVSLLKWFKKFNISIRSSRQDLTGKIINNLQFLEYSHSHPYSHVSYWKIKCFCGKEFITRAWEIKRKDKHRIKSCGCLSSSKHPWKNKNRKNQKSLSKKDHPSWQGYENISKSFYSHFKKGAERRHIDFSITIEEINQLFEKQNGKCFFSEENLIFNGSHGKSFGNASLDRKDSNKGYTKDNCQLVTKQINISKGVMNNQEFITMCQQVAKVAAKK